MKRPPPFAAALFALATIATPCLAQDRAAEVLFQAIKAICFDDSPKPETVRLQLRPLFQAIDVVTEPVGWHGVILHFVLAGLNGDAKVSKESYFMAGNLGRDCQATARIEPSELLLQQFKDFGAELEKTIEPMSSPHRLRLKQHNSAIQIEIYFSTGVAREAGATVVTVRFPQTYTRKN